MAAEPTLLPPLLLLRKYTLREKNIQYNRYNSFCLLDLPADPFGFGASICPRPQARLVPQE